MVIQLTPGALQRHGIQRDDDPVMVHGLGRLG
jgi:hypothetical protein